MRHIRVLLQKFNKLISGLFYARFHQFTQLLAFLTPVIISQPPFGITLIVINMEKYRNLIGGRGWHLLFCLSLDSFRHKRKNPTQTDVTRIRLSLTFLSAYKVAMLDRILKKNVLLTPTHETTLETKTVVIVTEKVHTSKKHRPSSNLYSCVGEIAWRRLSSKIIGNLIHHASSAATQSNFLSELIKLYC